MKINGQRKRIEQEKDSLLAGLEPATFRLTAERANLLRHRSSGQFAIPRFKYVPSVLFRFLRDVVLRFTGA